MDIIFSFHTVLLSITIIFLIKALFSCINKNSNKTHPPSPPTLPFLGHLHLLKPRRHHAVMGLSNRYGQAIFLRFASHPVLVISSPTLAKQCFTTHDLAFANRVQLPSITLPNTIGMVNYGSYWHNIRQIAAMELLSNQRIQASSAIRAQEVRDMVRQLFQFYNRTEKLEKSGGFEKIQMKTLLVDLLLNVIMMMIAGRRFCGYTNEENKEEMKQYKKAVEDLFELTGSGNIEDFIPILRILDLKGVMKKLRHATDVTEMMAQKLIDEHRHGGSENRKTMIARMLELQKEDSEKYSDVVIRNVCISVLFGGSETSTTTLLWAMANLLNHPDKLRKATTEIDEHVGNERLIEESDMANIPYLQHILQETLRMYPTFPLLLPHESSKKLTVGGYNIPPGTMLLVNAYQIQRNPQIWDEPTQFKPERFENGNSNGKLMIPFGMGRRRCPGEALAMCQMFLALGTLIQCFDWERIEDKPVDMKEGAGLSLPMATPLEALYRPRQAMIQVLSKL